MDKKIEPIVQTLQETFDATCEEFRGEAHIFVKADQIVDALTLLRDKHEFELLSALTATDYYPQQTPRFHVIYQMSSLAQNTTLQLRVPVAGDQLNVPTVSHIYQTANWREREVNDMFGIVFEGHPDPRKILTPDDLDAHPLRKDFPLGYEEPQFTFNFDDIDLSKIYAKE
ncbi:MAG: NADH-quinone oxidoreductase subunit C [Anaerolineaceae bacterium]|nr:MAG: NADH-quinone oxidoreductase subunit C [Anaerolineaceae bacterium]